MLKIKILKVGKLKEEYKKAESEFLKRLKGFCDMEIIDKKDDTAIEKSLNGDTHIIVLDRTGTQYSSEEFAEVIREQKDFGKGSITFVIGGPHGLAPEVIAKANQKLSFGKFTYTHQLAYILLLEQVYRATTILSNKKYHY